MGKFWWPLTIGVAVVSILFRQNLLFLLSLLLALMGGASVFWARVCLSGVTYQRRFGSLRLFFGEETDLFVEVVNAKPLPLAWLRAEDECPAALTMAPARLASTYQPARKRLVNLLTLRWYERVTRHYHVCGTRRGAWAFGPVELSSGDIFGFTLRRELAPGIDTLVVYPRIVPLTALGLPARRPFGDFGTPHRLSEDPLRVSGARAYAPGDSMRHIHWKATARHQELQTKQFDPSASHPLAIFLNVNIFERLWQGIDSELLEYAITATASVARWAWDNRHPIGLYANAVVQPGGRPVAIAPSSHRDQLLHILDALARTSDYARWPIESTLQQASLHLPYGATVVVVTAVVSDLLVRMLLELRVRDFGVTLITLGQADVAQRIPGIRVYHIGGRKEWQELATLALA
jgi:uncharacterized protein (DUF58 family)